MRIINWSLAICLVFTVVFFSGERNTRRAGMEGTSELACTFAAFENSSSLFFDESKALVFYSDVEKAAAKKNLKLLGLSYARDELQGLKALIVNKITYSITVRGAYPAARSLLSDLASAGRRASVESFRFFSEPPDQEYTVLEMNLALYSLKGIRKIDYSNLVSAGREIATFADSAAATLEVPILAAIPDIFKMPRDQRKVVISVEKKDDTGSAQLRKDFHVKYEVMLGRGPSSQSSEIIAKAADIPVPTRFSLRYSGFVSGKRKVKGFIEYNGRVCIVSPGDRLGDEYEVLSVNEAAAVLRLIDDPMSTIELRIKK